MRAQQFELQIKHHLEQAGLRKTSPAGSEAPQEQRRNALSQRAGGEVIANRESYRNRRLVTRSVQPRNARDRLRERILAGPVLSRTNVTIPARRTVNDARIYRPHRIVTEADPVHHTRPEVLDDYVGMGNQLAHALKVLRLLEIGDHTKLVAIHRMEGDRFPISRAAGERQTTTDVAPDGSFDPDHTRPQNPPTAPPQPVPRGTD